MELVYAAVTAVTKWQKYRAGFKQSCSGTVCAGQLLWLTVLWVLSPSIYPALWAGILALAQLCAVAVLHLAVHKEQV